MRHIRVPMVPVALRDVKPAGGGSPQDPLSLSLDILAAEVMGLGSRG